MPNVGDIRIVSDDGTTPGTRVDVCVVSGPHADDARWEQLRGVVQIELAPIAAGDGMLRASILFELHGGVDIAVASAQLHLPQQRDT